MRNSLQTAMPVIYVCLLQRKASTNNANAAGAARTLPNEFLVVMPGSVSRETLEAADRRIVGKVVGRFTWSMVAAF